MGVWDLHPVTRIEAFLSFHLVIKRRRPTGLSSSLKRFFLRHDGTLSLSVVGTAWEISPDIMRARCSKGGTRPDFFVYSRVLSCRRLKAVLSRDTHRKRHSFMAHLHGSHAPGNAPESNDSRVNCPLEAERLESSES